MAGNLKDEAARVFEALDLNGDGKISRAEFIRTIRSSAEIAKVFDLPTTIRQEQGREAFEQVFQSMDNDGDRFITLDEVDRLLRQDDDVRSRARRFSQMSVDPIPTATAAGPTEASYSG